MWTSREFDGDYFERGIETGRSLYTRYHWMPERTIPFAARLCEELPIARGERVLDFGCAYGFLVKALRLLGRDATGVDVSEWAIAHAPQDVVGHVRCIAPGGHVGGPYDLVVAKDVLEHVDESSLGAVLADLAVAGQRLFVAVPLGDGERYIIPAYEQDATHVIRRPLEWWREQLSAHGWRVRIAAHRLADAKLHWVTQYPEGNGFFVGERG